MCGNINGGCGNGRNSDMDCLFDGGVLCGACHGRLASCLSNGEWGGVMGGCWFWKEPMLEWPAVALQTGPQLDCELVCKFDCRQGRMRQVEGGLAGPAWAWDDLLLYGHNSQVHLSCPGRA